MTTESRNPRSIGLDKMSALEIVRLMNEEEMAVFEALRKADEPLAKAAEKAAESFQKGGRIIYVGAGTSGRIAIADSAEMPPTFGLEPGRFVALMAGGTQAGAQAMEGAEDNTVTPIEELNALKLNPDDIVIGLAASGGTPYVIAALKHARQKGVYTVGIANNPGAPIFDVVDLPILLHTGPEVLTGSTRLKAGTSQKLALNRISTCAMVLSGKVIENLMVDVKATNQKLRERCARIVVQLTGLTSDEAREFLENNSWSVRAAIEEAREHLAKR